jgi:hypothetical protein
LRVAAGLDWFGRKVMGGPVIYCACEAGRSIANRVEAFKIAHSCDENSGIPFAAVTSPIDLCHPQIGDLQKLTNLLHETHDLSPVSLIVIDTVSRALAGGNENSPDDMGAFVRSLDQLREQLGCHILGVHHSGKDTSKGSRGHSLLHCAVDTELLIVRDDTTSISVAKVTKQRDGIAGIEIAFRLRPIELGLDDDGELVTSCVVEPADGQQRRPSKARLPAAQARALQLLNDTIVREGTTPPANSHIPPNTLCVTESLWRECCYRGSISGSDKLQAKQKAFKRSADDLITAGYIGKWEPWVWAVKQ